jgi:hypothetical protein
MKPERLGSVHLSKSDLAELEELLRSFAEEPIIEISVKPNGIQTTASSVDELINENHLGEDSIAYEMCLWSMEGDIRLVADSTDVEEHLLFANGFDDNQSVIQDIKDFMRQRRGLSRSYFSGNLIFWSTVASAFFFASSLDFLIPGPIVYPVYDELDFAILPLSALALYATRRKNLVYPYFAVSFDSDTKYPRLLSRDLLYYIIIGFVIGVLASLIV